MSVEADIRTRQILLTQPETSQLVVDSPPGAGKTGVVERLAMQSAWVHGERVAVATQTKAQSLDVARRLASGWPSRQVYLFIRRGQSLPGVITQLSNLKAIENLSGLPEGPCVVIANAAKWGFAGEASFDLMVVDEAYQLRDSQFIQIAGLAERHILVGDPGQIDPVVSADTARWRDMKSGPHTPAPRALLFRRQSGVLRVDLPVSRRLPADTVRYIQPAFYPDLPFTATSEPEDRRLICEPSQGHSWDPAIDAACSGASLLMGQLPALATGEFDGDLSDSIAALARRLLERGARCLDDDRESQLEPGDIGVVCAHRSQVYSIQQRLGPDLAEVYVETADRYQGLERKVMIVYHPLSGRMGLSGFQLDTGRLCVMTSRHRISCFIVGREGIADRLRALPPPVERILGVEENPFHRGRAAHLNLLEALGADDRLLTVGG